jgi:hypothetical protein
MDPPELILDRLRLEAQYLKTLTILYRPFLDQPEHEQEHQQCLEAAVNLVREQIPLLEATQPGGQLSGFVVFIRRLVHDFNLAAMLLCSDLKKQAASTAPRLADQDRASLVRHLLLQACDLWLMSGVTSHKARHAVHAIQKFLQQDQYTSRATIPAAGGIPTPEADYNVGGFSSGFQSGTPSDMFMDGSIMLDDSPNAQDTFNIEQDPLFRDLFGPGYAMPDGMQANWQ